MQDFKVSLSSNRCLFLYILLDKVPHKFSIGFKSGVLVGQFNNNINYTDRTFFNIVSFFVYYSIWMINLYFKVIQVLFFPSLLFVREIISKEHARPQIFVLYTRHISQHSRYIYFFIFWFGLILFSGISTIVGYLMPNPFLYL